MKYNRALELFFLKAKEEFDRQKKGNEANGIEINYIGCDFADGKIVLHGERIVYGSQHPINGRISETYPWEKGIEVFEATMKDLAE